MLHKDRFLMSRSWHPRKHETHEKGIVETSATVTIRRPKGLVGAIRKFPVLCNGVEVARVANNATVTFSVPAGKHAFLVKFDWLCAKPLKVTLAPGEQLFLICATPDDFTQSLLATFRLSNTYLQLRRQSAADETRIASERPAPFPWKTVGLQCAAWFAIIVAFSVIMMVIIMNAEGNEQLQEARAGVMGMITGVLLVIGWAVVVLRAFTNHNRGK